MDGHRQAQERVSNPALTFLRKLALAVAVQGRPNEQLIASKLYEVAEYAEPPIEIPGLREADADNGKRRIGSIMAKLFKDSVSTKAIDDFTVTRDEVETDREDGGGRYIAKAYRFVRSGG